MRKTFKAAAVCTLAAILLVSCGGKGGSESNTASTTANTPIATATPGPTPVPKPDIMAPEDAVISIGDYKNITFDAYKSEMTEEDAKEYYSEQVEQSIAAGQTGFETLEDRAGTEVADGDVLNINFEGKDASGNSIDGLTGEDVTITIGSGDFVEGFEEALIGVKIGEATDFDVTFPADFNDTELAGQKVSFHVTVNYAQELVPVTEDNAYFYMYGYDTYEECIDYLKGYLQDNLPSEEQYISDCRINYASRVASLTEYVDLTAEIDYVYSNIVSTLETFASNYGAENIEQFALAVAGYSSMEEFEAYYRGSAEKQIKIEYAFEYIAKQEGITVSDEEYNTYALDNAQMAGYSSVSQYESGYDAQFGAGSYRRYCEAMIISGKLYDMYAKFE